MWVMDKESHRCLTFPEEKGTSVRHGHWIGVSQTKFEQLFFSQRVFKCSVCGNYLDFDGVNAGRGSANFCPHCGAKMDESTMGQVKPSDKEFTLYADEKPIVTFKDSKIVLHGERREDAE